MDKMVKSLTKLFRLMGRRNFQKPSEPNTEMGGRMNNEKRISTIKQKE
jgi:hypothetical protein